MICHGRTLDTYLRIMRAILKETPDITWVEAQQRCASLFQ